MERLADVYFDKIHPVYGFVDKDTLKHKVSTRWDETSAPERYDAVLLGVAALGSLFSGESVRDQERELAQTAGNMLEPASTSARPVYYDAVAWLLRTIYLRVTSPPHAAWMASGITMQLIEATGAHQDPDSSSSISPDTCDKITGKEFQRRLFWVATVLNSWISNECGRSRVVLQAASCNEPHSHHGNLTSDMVKLYRISELLEPNNQDEVSGLTGGLSEVENLELTHDALILSQANLAFAMYRRLRASGSHLPNEALGRIIRMGNTGLDAAVRMAEDRCPWWHVANVPFQFVCVLVAMETNESLSHLGRALQALRTIAQRFGTKTIQAALQTAESLIRMSKKQKERQVSMLETALGQQDGLSEPTVQASREPTVLSASGELPPAQNDDVLNWGWDDFLNVDIPVFGDLGFIDHGNAGHFD